MRRREFIKLVGGAALGGAQKVSAQSTSPVRRVGVCWGLPANDPIWGSRFQVFTQSLKELGWLG